MLTTVESLLLIPGMTNLAAAPTAWVNTLLAAADRAIKRYCKRDLEMTAYDEPYSGAGVPDLVLRQYPVWVGATAIAPGSVSDGALLPQATIVVNSTRGFHPGTGGNTRAKAPAIAVQVGPSSWTWVSYTGTTQAGFNGATVDSFTGCTLGGPAGTMNSTYANGVTSPVVFVNPQGYFGQGPAPGFFATTSPGTSQLFMGTQFAVNVDAAGQDGMRSERGLLTRVGGAGGAWVGMFPPDGYGWSGKLAGRAFSSWPQGTGNIWVKYTAGYAPYGSGYHPQVPEDLQYAVGLMVAYMVRNAPRGVPLTSESLGSYSYSILDKASTEIPELGSLARTLAPFRESSW